MKININNLPLNRLKMNIFLIPSHTHTKIFKSKHERKKGKIIQCNTKITRKILIKKSIDIKSKKKSNDIE